MPSFLSPLFLLGAAAAAIPIILHFLRREPESRVRFAAVRLLTHGPVEQTKNRRLREWLLLALRVSALVLLAIAFARPFFPSATDSFGSATIVALDTSLSMSAPGRFEQARNLAKQAIGRAPLGSRVAVVTFADRAEIASGLSGDRSLAVSAVDAAAPNFRSTSYRAALGAAATLLEGHGGTIVLVTDLQEAGWDAGDQVALAGSVRVEVADAGALPPNLAVTAVRVERERVVATVRNFGEQAREARVELTVRRGDAASGKHTEESGGAGLASLGPGQAADVPLPRPAADAASVRIADPEGIAADNVRYMVLENARSKILIVATGSDLEREALYLQQALTAGDTGTPVDGVSAAQLASWDAARLQPYATIVLASTQGLERRGRDLLRGYLAVGGGLLVAASPEIDGDVVRDVAGDVSIRTVAPAGGEGKTPSRTLAPVDARHPLFRVFGGDTASLALVTFRQIVAVAGDGCQTLARFTTGEPAMLDCTREQGRVMLLASDLNNRWNDFPLRPTFVPFLHETITYLAGARSGRSEYIVGEQPSGVEPVPGLSALQAANGPARWVAVNVDPRESEPGRMTGADFDAAVARVKQSALLEAGAIPVEMRQQEDRQHLWQYVLAVVILTLVAETFVAARAV